MTSFDWPDSLLELADQLRTPLVVIGHLLRRSAASSRLTMPQSAVLGQLLTSPRRVTDLAEIEGVRPPTMTGLLNRMERQGWVRSRSADDRRVRIYEISPAGRQELAAAIVLRNEMLAARLRELGTDDLARLREALPALLQLAGVEPVRSGLDGREH
jgi:DNA-binding MarR family transcriptional regulator